MHRPFRLSFAVALILAAYTARADSTREYEPAKPAAPVAPAVMTLDAAQQKVDASDYRGAIPSPTAVVQKDPNNADALNLMGYSLRKTGQADLALQYYNKALSLNPKHLGTNEYLGELYVEKGQMDKAKEHLAVLRGGVRELRADAGSQEGHRDRRAKRQEVVVTARDRNEQPLFLTPRLRNSGASIGYQLASIIAGGPALFIATWLFASHHSTFPVGIYAVICAVISIVTTLMLPDYTNKGTSTEAGIRAGLATALD
ncbi:MAG: tetratricopeptide repeat protein [Stellaceae bacterium]